MLNINELANAIKPVVLPGEKMTVTVVKDGKEHNQGVAYLDDGTMIVVENGRRFIGETIEVEVTSVIQNQCWSNDFRQTVGKIKIAWQNRKTQTKKGGAANGLRCYGEGFVAAAPFGVSERL